MTEPSVLISIPNSQSSILDPQSSTLDPQSSVLIQTSIEKQERILPHKRIPRNRELARWEKVSGSERKGIVPLLGKEAMLRSRRLTSGADW